MSDQRLIELLDETTNLKIEVAKLREAIKLMRGALEMTDRQDRVKGYPTGREWAILRDAQNEALATVDKLLGEK